MTQSDVDPWFAEIASEAHRLPPTTTCGAVPRTQPCLRDVLTCIPYGVELGDVGPAT